MSPIDSGYIESSKDAVVSFNIIRRPVYSRNNVLCGNYYKIKFDNLLSESYGKSIRLKEVCQASFLNKLLHAVGLKGFRRSAKTIGLPCSGDLYFLDMSQRFVASKYICSSLVSASREIESAGGQLVLIISGCKLDQRRLIKSFYDNYIDLADEGVVLGMNFDLYINDPKLPEFLLRTLRYIWLDPFEVGMPESAASVSYPNVMYAGEVVREIHNRLDVKVVAINIATKWQKKVVTSLPVHYLLGDYYGGYEELARARL